MHDNAERQRVLHLKNAEDSERQAYSLARAVIGLFFFMIVPRWICGLNAAIFAEHIGGETYSQLWQHKAIFELASPKCMLT